MLDFLMVNVGKYTVRPMDSMDMEMRWNLEVQKLLLKDASGLPNEFRPEWMEETLLLSLSGVQSPGNDRLVL